ncbi:MAG: CcmD family protein [Balneolales bacterium]
MLNSFFLLVIAFLSGALELYQNEEPYEQYQGAEATEGLMGWMASNDLIFVVLGVSLIIWFTLLAFLYKIDRKVSYLEQKHDAEPHIE